MSPNANIHVFKSKHTNLEILIKQKNDLLVRAQRKKGGQNQEKIKNIESFVLE